MSEEVKATKAKDALSAEAAKSVLELLEEDDEFEVSFFIIDIW